MDFAQCLSFTLACTVYLTFNNFPPILALTLAITKKK